MVGVLAGCSNGGGVDVGGSGGSGSSGGSGGTLNAAIGGEPDQLDPHKTSAYYSFEVLENVYDTLVEPDADLKMQPSLAFLLDDQQGAAHLDLQAAQRRDFL